MLTATVWAAYAAVSGAYVYFGRRDWIIVFVATFAAATSTFAING